FASRSAHDTPVTAGSGLPPYHARTAAAPYVSFTKPTKAPLTVYATPEFAPRKPSANRSPSFGRMPRSFMALAHSAGERSPSRGEAATATPSIRPGFGSRPARSPPVSKG